MKQVTKYCLYAMEIGPYSDNKYHSFSVCADTRQEIEQWIKDYNSNSHKFEIRQLKLWDID